MKVLRQYLLDSTWSYPVAISIAVLSVALLLANMQNIWRDTTINHYSANSIESQSVPMNRDQTSISTWRLMGVLPPENIEVADLPSTLLSLDLHGVMINQQPQQSLAIISVAGNSEDFYAIGDQIAGGATIHNILSDRVVLQRDDRLELLTLPDQTIKQEV